MLGTPQVIHTIVGLRLAHGGPSRSVPALADAQATLGERVLLVDTMFDEYAENGLPKKAQFIGIPGANLWPTLCCNRNLLRQMRGIIAPSSSVVLHDHGVWLPPNRVLADLSSDPRVIRVVSPRGMLSDWALQRKWRAKTAVWYLWQRRALASASGFHATSEQEASEIRRLGFRQPICVVPNAVSCPVEIPRRSQGQQGKRMLFLSRIHPKKGIAELLEAFRRANLPPEWQLQIVGSGEPQHESMVRLLIDDFQLKGRVRFDGPANDNDKWQFYADADVFVLPSFSENFGIVIAEALAAGLPVITTTGTPWESIKEQRMGWWVSPEVASLTSALQEVSRMAKEELSEMGARGAEFVRSTFSWDSSARKLIDFYRTL